jgi:hypothetical protein
MNTRRQKYKSSYGDDISKAIDFYCDKLYSYDMSLRNTREAKDRTLTEFLDYGRKHRIDRSFLQESLVKAGYALNTAKVMLSAYRNMSEEAKQRMSTGNSTFGKERAQRKMDKSEEGITGQMLRKEYANAVRQVNLSGKRLRKTKSQHLQYIENDWDIISKV